MDAQFMAVIAQLIPITPFEVLVPTVCDVKKLSEECSEQ